MNVNRGYCTLETEVFTDTSLRRITRREITFLFLLFHNVQVKAILVILQKKLKPPDEVKTEKVAIKLYSKNKKIKAHVQQEVHLISVFFFFGVVDERLAAEWHCAVGCCPFLHSSEERSLT